MDKFRHVIEAGIRHQTPSSVLSLYINLTLHAVGRDDIFVSPTLIEKWTDIIGNENKNKQEEKLKGLQCFCMDGKSINAAIGHHQTKREHELIFVKEPPPVEYIDHCLAVKQVLQWQEWQPKSSWTLILGLLWLQLV